MISPVAFELTATLFQSFISVWFIARFHRHRYFGDGISLLFSALLSVSAILGDYFQPGFSTFPLIRFFSLNLLYALLICGRSYARAVLSVCIIQTDLTVVAALTYSVLSYVVDDFDIAMQGSDSLLRYVYLVIGNLLFFVVAKLILNLSVADGSPKPRTTLATFSASLLTLLGLGATMKIADYPFAGQIKISIIILTCVFVAINIILYFLVDWIHKLEKLRAELQLMRERLRFEEERIQDAGTMLETCRQIRHDMKQHLILIEGYLKDGKTTECQEYIAQLSSETNMSGQLIQTGSTVIDYLTNSKLGRLCGVQVKVSGDIGNLSDIREVDLSCLLGNLLDNAVEAVSKLPDSFPGKQIELTFAKYRQNRIILCCNSIQESVLKKNPYLNSTKPDAGEHGLGHKVVAEIVRKYGGFLTYFEEDGMFGAQIILPDKD